MKPAPKPAMFNIQSEASSATTTSTPDPEPDDTGFFQQYCSSCSGDGGNPRPKNAARKSAFERPFDTLQIATWVLFPLVIVHFYCFLYFLLWPHIASRVVITLVFSICVSIAAYSTYKVCTIDPVDDEFLTPGSNPPPASQIRYCYQCDRKVGKLSLHCHDCNKCVQVFDHHCKWLNTCVGAKNYKYFLGVIFSVCGLTTLSMSLSIAFLVELCQYPSQFKYRMEYANENYVFMNMYDNTCLGVLIFSLILLIPLVIMVWQLTLFHSYLVYNKLTTYEFIMSAQKQLNAKIQASKPQNQQTPRPVAKSSMELIPMVPAGGSSSSYSSSVGDGGVGGGGVVDVNSSNSGLGTAYVQASTTDIEAGHGRDSDSDSDGFEQPDNTSDVVVDTGESGERKIVTI